MPSGIQTLVTVGEPSALPIAAPISRLAWQCSIQNWRMPLSGCDSVKPLGRLGMREAGRVEIQSDAERLGPVDPVLEMARFDFVAVHFLAAKQQYM